MGRALVATARMVHWIAGEAIVCGQTVIREACEWRRWAERHVMTPTEIPRQSPPEGASASESEGYRSPPVGICSTRKN